jgi:hypothetical protein
VDFWDITRLLLRRWYVATPLLVITLAIGAWTYTTVQPDYKGVSYVQLVPPPAPTTPGAELRNQWIDLGLGSLNTAATYATADAGFLAELKARGLSDNVVIDTGYPAPIATVTVIGSSKQQTLETVNAVVEHFEETVKGLQDAYGVQQSSLIQTRRLDTGQNLEETGGKVKRAFIAVVGAGVLLSVAVTVAFDAIARRRTRRRLEQDGSPAAAGPPAESPGDEVAPPAMSPNMPRAGSRGRSNLPPIRMNGTSEETIVLPRPVVDRAKSRDSGSASAPRIIRQRALNGADHDDAAEETAAAEPAPTEANDRTIVLPRATAGGVTGDGGGRRT